jgi:anti-anti-sigma regulatory factor
MAFFSKPPAKKPDPAKSGVRSRVGPPSVGARGVSARELAAHASTAGQRRPVDPVGDDSTISGANLNARTPTQSAFEVAQANPGLCAVLENAALKYASGHPAEARALLEQGVEDDNDTKLSVLAWLALFDLLQRLGDRGAFDQLALKYVVQFERSAPGWESSAKPKVAARSIGGQIVIGGRLTAASATQIDGLKRAVARQAQAIRLDLQAVIGFDDDGARLLADALAEARRAKLGLQVQPGVKLGAALDAALSKGREAGEGAWLLSLELLQWANGRAVFEDRAVDFAVAFELSPPSWEPPPAPQDGTAAAGESTDAQSAVVIDPDVLQWTGVMAGAAAPQLSKLAAAANGKAMVPVDVSEVERIDFVCAGALLNLITRIEGQRKAIQIVGASPIVRALLLLIGVSPRHFVKKSS